jgi:Xaa-Pro aminopeptidase
MATDYEGCKAAIEALEDAYGAVFAAARPGMTAEEVDAVLRERLTARGTEFPASGSSPFVVAEGGAPPKLRLNRVPLRRGALWAMDNTIRLSGYCADLGRYGWFGRVPPELARAHRRVLDRQDAIAAAIRPGRAMSEIFGTLPHDLPFEYHRIAADGNMFPTGGNATAGVLKAMEQSDREGLVFQPGMVICVEIWAGLIGGIEDMYLVEPPGVRRMSTLPREIHVIPDAAR